MLRPLPWQSPLENKYSRIQSQGELYLEEQCEWYQAMFEACKNRSWLRGFALWEWAPKLPSESEAWKDDSYEICNKPVQEVIRIFYENETEKYFTACTEK